MRKLVVHVSKGPIPVRCPRPVPGTDRRLLRLRDRPSARTRSTTMACAGSPVGAACHATLASSRLPC